MYIALQYNRVPQTAKQFSKGCFSINFRFLLLGPGLCQNLTYIIFVLTLYLELEAYVFVQKVKKMQYPSKRFNSQFVIYYLPREKKLVFALCLSSVRKCIKMYENIAMFLVRVPFVFQVLATFFQNRFLFYAIFVKVVISSFFQPKVAKREDFLFQLFCTIIFFP